ncbi:PAS domain S-box protein, partial [Paenibacillus sepulcri]|nr:PAS domain S-box protein [Paenibacillus sepulcri]
ENGGDEISQLSHSVNDMRLHLRDMFGRLEAIINQNQFAFIVLDDQYRVTYFSKAAELMLGYKAEEVVNKATAITFIDPDDLQAEARRLSRRLLRSVPPDLSVLRELRR